ncbi:MAG: aminotransferase class V-fold PLP-dependent enzyme [Alphaproteobacteria bacterium]|nr:aminotransferase class V-fold PLP-dependent enzyme [Alphaproteobacteria bacterium]
MDVYDRLRVRKRVNGAGLLTRLGGSLMAPEVLAAMQEAAQSYVDMAELHTRASEVIAVHTGAEAGLVTSGAAAALTLGTAACITGHDVHKMERLPQTDGMPNEVIMFRMHRTGYDHAIRAAGARIREIGFNDLGVGAGVRGLEPWEIHAAISPATVAVAYTMTPSRQPPLGMVAEVAARHNLPLIVDAAAQLPPKENLCRFIAEGATLVAFSGGKAIRGPQGTGILCGRRELISAALIQQLDMDVSPQTWDPPQGLLSKELLRAFPHHGLGRGFKVAKEQIVGLLVALERFAAADSAGETRLQEEQLEALATALKGTPHLKATLLSGAVTGRYPVLELVFDEAALRASAYQISLRLQAGSPPVHLSERRAQEGMLVVDPAGLKPDDAPVIAAALRAACSTASP